MTARVVHTFRAAIRDTEGQRKTTPAACANRLGVRGLTPISDFTRREALMSILLSESSTHKQARRTPRGMTR